MHAKSYVAAQSAAQEVLITKACAFYRKAVGYSVLSAHDLDWTRSPGLVEMQTRQCDADVATVTADRRDASVMYWSALSVKNSERGADWHYVLASEGMDADEMLAAGIHSEFSEGWDLNKFPG